MAIERDDVLVWRGLGLVRVDGKRPEGWVMRSLDAGSVMILPEDRAASVVRRPVSHGEAIDYVRALRAEDDAVDERPEAVRFHDAMVALVRRPLAVQVGVLHALYRSPYAPSFGERRLIDSFERLVVGELAHVLDEPLGELIATLREGQPAFAAHASPREPEPEPDDPIAPVPLEGHEYLGQLAVPRGKIAIGELTSAAFVVDGHPGDWHAYATEDLLALVHTADLRAYRTLADGAIELAALRVEGGTMAMADAEVRDTEAFQEAAMFPVSPIIDGRGCVVRTGGDGAFALRGARRGDRFALLIVDLA